MNALYGLQLNNFPARIPEKNVVLGGRLCLYGNFASLACFHGTNFRTQNWGLFTVREPGLQFTSETRVVERSCQVMRAACVHDVTFSLGKCDKHTITERRKSTVNMYGEYTGNLRDISWLLVLNALRCPNDELSVLYRSPHFLIENIILV